jgi:hypothetical protein
VSETFIMGIDMRAINFHCEGAIAQCQSLLLSGANLSRIHQDDRW